jgi:two-component system phosphate regulon sensor histidine kinase PhoR
LEGAIRKFGFSRLRLFWRLGLFYLLLLLLVLAAVDIYMVQVLRRDYRESAFSRLESLANLVQNQIPDTGDAADLQSWVSWLELSGVRATVVDAGGKVLADSEANPLNMENHVDRPEIQSAFSEGKGRAVRRSNTLGLEFVYFAIRHNVPNSGSVVIRLATPLHQLDEALANFRKRLWIVSCIILALAGGAWLVSFRAFSERIEHLKQFSRRIAGGDFTPIPADRKGDELSDLSRTMNDTAGQLSQTIKDLTAERNKSAAILSSMVEGVAVISSGRRMIYGNDAFFRALTIEGLTWEGRPIVEVIRQSDLLAAFEKALSTRESAKSELVIGALRTRSFDVTVTPIQAGGVASGAVMVLHDITELRRLERARRDFVANVSHEFRTPLAAIQGFTETLLEGAVNDHDDRTRFLEIIRNNAIRLGRMTEDLLKLSRIEAGKTQVEPRSIAVPDLVEPCMEITQLKAQEKNLALETKYEPDLPAALGDPASLQEVLLNLLDNAVCYTPPGGKISVRAALRGDRIAIAVIDTGIGIPKAEQERIFERFYRIDPARSRELGGTGLGLSIAKHLVESNSGQIEVASEVGRGSTFSILLPIAGANAG